MQRISTMLINLAALGLIAMTAVIGWQVFGRFVLDSSPSWSEQTALLLMVWYVFFAAAAGVWERFHIRIEILEHRMQAANVRKLRIAIHALIALLSLAIAVYGGMLAWLVHDNVIPSLGLSRSWAYVPLMLAGALMVLFSLGRIHKRWTEKT
ncbi:TRAP transporter small permease [Paraurantiacibacter namhicola]|uniref:TRAP transporter small permease protein n=1 Tax=Paraurantiacibacter namhicola TaxID=645517 RepID=A0A1C7D783_9SPHN|nr:TRAP transporter small permease [Paraurantiacibacter namhicola]ANU07334.1 2,3-diketo-L-gulonate TRAP transporter small permease protein YiaM [Paraurantiacibacter namhicola]